MKPNLVKGPEIDRSGLEAMAARGRKTPVVVVPEELAQAIPSWNDPDRWNDDTYVEFCSKDEVKIRQARLDAAEAKRARRQARNLKEKKP